MPDDCSSVCSRCLGKRDADHGVPCHQRRQLVFRPTVGTRRALRQHEIAHVRSGVVNPDYGVIGDLGAEFPEKVLLVAVSMPALKTPPPNPPAVAHSPSHRPFRTPS